jgi:type IV pilus assembly protein PilE
MRQQGFTLIELLVALAILAIVAAIAMPIYNEYSVRTYRTDAQKDLLACAQGMERAASAAFTYAGAVDTDADGVGDADTGPVSANLCTPTSRDYDVTVVVANANTFTLRATPTGGPVADDGLLEYDAAGVRRWDKNDDGAADDADESDWDY